MKRGYLIFVSFSVVIFALWCFHKSNIATNAVLPTNSAVSSAKPVLNAGSNSVSLSKPRLFYSTNYPPVTPEEKTEWDWWRAMRKADPSFEWKTPIEFYGRVVDQFSNGVEGASVVLTWTTVVGPSPDPTRTIMSGKDGCFSVSGIHGKGIGVNIMKDGYLRTSNSHMSFEYSDFTDQHFHVPDSNNPVVFRLHKVMDAEPLYLFETLGKLPAGKVLSVDLANGKIVPDGDFSFTLLIGDKRDEYGRPDYKLIIEAHNGAGFVLTNEEFPALAPETGYQKLLTVDRSPFEPDYGISENLRFYARTQSGKYALLGVVISVPRRGTTGDFKAGTRLNPSGSRNLEFDEDKLINR